MKKYKFDGILMAVLDGIKYLTIIAVIIFVVVLVGDLVLSTVNKSILYDATSEEMIDEIGEYSVLIDRDFIGIVDGQFVFSNDNLDIYYLSGEPGEKIKNSRGKTIVIESSDISRRVITFKKVTD